MSSNVPQFVQIGLAYQNGNITDAIAQNNSVVAVNTIEENTRFVNHLVLLMYSNAYQMDEDLMDELRKIALQEPSFSYSHACCISFCWFLNPLLFLLNRPPSSPRPPLTIDPIPPLIVTGKQIGRAHV